MNKAAGLAPSAALCNGLRFELSPAGGLNGEIQLAACGMKMFFGLCSVARHIVVVGGARVLHLVNCLGHVLLNSVEVVPVPHLCRYNSTCNES